MGLPLKTIQKIQVSNPWTWEKAGRDTQLIRKIIEWELQVAYQKAELGAAWGWCANKAKICFSWQRWAIKFVHAMHGVGVWASLLNETNLHLNSRNMQNHHSTCWWGLLQWSGFPPPLDFSLIESGNMELEIVTLTCVPAWRVLWDGFATKSVNWGLTWCMQLIKMSGTIICDSLDCAMYCELLSMLLSLPTMGKFVGVHLNKIDADRKSRIVEFEVRDPGIGLTCR